MQFKSVELRRESGENYSGDRPNTVKELISIDMQGPLDPEVLHEWLWDSLQIKTDSIPGLESISLPLREYVSVWSVRNYVGNGGIDAPLFSVPLTLSYAKQGYQAIDRPIAADAVDRMICAINYVLDENSIAIEELGVTFFLDDLSKEHWDKIDEILEPGGIEVDFSEFDAVDELASYVRKNYSYFLECELPV